MVSKVRFDEPAEQFTDADRGEWASTVLRGMFILMTALCWGAYGPVLHKGQQVMGGSRMRPFLCVGLAYFVVAVIFPLMIQPAFKPEPGTWFTFGGWFWSLLGGSVGALGALGDHLRLQLRRQTALRHALGLRNRTCGQHILRNHLQRAGQFRRKP